MGAFTIRGRILGFARAFKRRDVISCCSTLAQTNFHGVRLQASFRFQTNLEKGMSLRSFEVRKLRYSCQAMGACSHILQALSGLDKCRELRPSSHMSYRFKRSIACNETSLSIHVYLTGCRSGPHAISRDCLTKALHSLKKRPAR